MKTYNNYVDTAFPLKIKNYLSILSRFTCVECHVLFKKIMVAFFVTELYQ